MRGATPPHPQERSAPSSLDKSSSRRAIQSQGRTRSPGKDGQNTTAAPPSRPSKERLIFSASLTNVGGGNWNSEESQGAPRPTTMRLFQSPTAATSSTSSRRPMVKPGFPKAGSSSTMNSTMPLGFGDPSPRTPGSPGSDAVPKRKMRITEKPPPDVQPFHNTTGLAMRKMMTATLKEAAEKDTKRKHVLQHLKNGSQNGFTDSIDGQDQPGSEGTPYEVLARGPRAHIHFLKALKFGTQRPRTLKLMFVGQGRAGKTSTLRRLTGRGFDKAEASTHGVACENTFKTSTDLVSSWKVLGRPELEMHKTELKTSLAREIVASIKEDEGNAVPQPVSLSKSALSPEGSPANSQRVDSFKMDDEDADPPNANSHNAIEHVSSKMPWDLITRYLQHGEDGAPEESLTLKTWDFAGQQEYYAMHHLFLTNRGIYLVVTRLDLWLPGAPTDVVSPLFEEEVPTSLDSDVILDGPDGASDPPLQALTFWLSSIHIHAPNSIIVIVATHKDKILGQEEEVYMRVEEEIQSLLERVPGVDGQLAVNQELGLCFFPIDNSQPSSADDEDASGITALREALDHLAREALSEGGCFGEALPLKWVQLREELGEMAQGTTGEPGQSFPMTAMFVISHLKVLEIARGLGIKDDDELRACLQYLHDTGSIVFFDEPELRDHVVLNPQWLTDAMAHVLNCPRVVRGANKGAKLLREKGELDAKLLREHLWKAHKFRDHTRILLPLLHRYDLLLPYHSGEMTASMSANIPRIGSEPALTSSRSPSSSGAVHIADCPTLLVPCLLPSSPALPAGVPAPEVAVWDALFFDFHGMLCRLLPTLFPKLLVAATRHPEIEGPLSSLGVFRDSFKLLWGSAQLAFELLPAGSRPQVVRVRLERWHGPSTGSEERSSGLPVRIVRELLTLVRTSLSQHNHITFSAGILCEHCHARGRKLSEQHHVIDLSELLGQAECGTCSSSIASPPGTIICRAQREVVEVPEQSWAGQWRKEVALRSLDSGQGHGMLADLGRTPEDARHQELFSDGDSIIQMDEALLVGSSIPSSVSSEIGMNTSRIDRASASGNAWRLNLLYASPLCYATEDGHLGAALPGSTPADLPQINIEAELALLWEAVGPPDEEAPWHEKSIDSCGGSLMAVTNRCGVVVDLATASKLRQLLTSGAGSDRRLLLHLSLHCVEGGRAVLMEDGNGGAHAISLEAFEELIRAGGSLSASVGFVFVNACSSDQLGRVLIALGVPHVICCQGAVFDAVARCFTKAFYLACSRGFTIEQAFDVARAEVRASPQPGLRGEAEKYMLLGGLDITDETGVTWHNRHSITLFEAAAPTCDSWGTRSARSLSEAAPTTGSLSLTSAAFWRPIEGGRLPPRTEDFCGRGRELWAIQSQLSIQRRCLTCNGEEGIGKSALLMELARYASAPGRRFSGAVVYATLGANKESFLADLIASADPGKAAPGDSDFLRRFLVDVLDAVQRASGKGGGESTPPMEEEGPEDEGLGWSSHWCAQHLKGTLVRLMKKLENQRNGGEALLIIDDLDTYLLEPSVVEEVRKVLIEVLLRTERTMLLLGSRRPIQGTLCSHKVVALPLTPLKPADAARLFLWRVHRPLTLRDLSAAGLGTDMPLVYDPRNRQMVLAQVANHPLLQACRGHPGEIRRVADLVRPGLDGASAPSLYDIFEEIFGTDERNAPVCF